MVTQEQAEIRVRYAEEWVQLAEKGLKTALETLKEIKTQHPLAREGQVWCYSTHAGDRVYVKLLQVYAYKFMAFTCLRDGSNVSTNRFGEILYRRDTVLPPEFLKCVHGA